jgi:hypothetical protein
MPPDVAYQIVHVRNLSPAVERLEHVGGLPAEEHSASFHH